LILLSFRKKNSTILNAEDSRFHDLANLPPQHKAAKIAA
jgi:hypothetical protein